MNLAYLTNVKLGGFATFTTHLLLGLRANGVKARLFKPAKKLERKLRPFFGGVGYQNVPFDFLRSEAKRTIIVCAYAKAFPEALEALLEGGASIVIHDPTELKGGLEDLVLRFQPKVIAIREVNALAFQQRGFEHVKLLPHPYMPMGGERATSRPKRAVSFSRIDFDKHTDIVVRASEVEPIDIYGAVNPMYAFHKLNAACPGWKSHYRGSFEPGLHAAVALASDYAWAVDMSVIAGDGGGTQYTFLEAWDAGCGLVLNRGWMREGGTIVEGAHCLSVKDHDELAHTIRRDVPLRLREAGAELLMAHDAKRVAAQFSEVFGG